MLVQTGYEVDDIGHSLSWDGAAAIINHVKADSALAKELAPDAYEWAGTTKTNMILADIFDLLNVINTHLAILVSKKKHRKPAPYPRPNAKKEKKQMTIGEMRRLYQKKKAEYVQHD